MLSNRPKRFEIKQCKFQLELIRGLIPIKFKCRFFVEVKTSNSLIQSKDHYRAINSAVNFVHEKLDFEVMLLYDNFKEKYLKKETQINVNLISDNKSNESKLVGRVKVDIGGLLQEVRANNQSIEYPTALLAQKVQELENCSVKKPEVAKVTFSLSILQEALRMEEITPSVFGEVDKTSFQEPSDYNEFYTEVFGERVDRSALSAHSLSKASTEMKTAVDKRNINNLPTNSKQPSQGQEGAVRAPEDGKEPYLTEEAFEEQQMIIHSLQDELEEANEIIEQYRTELELAKEEAERLEKQRDRLASVSEVRSMRSNQASTPVSPKADRVVEDAEPLRRQMAELRQVIVEKEDIISAKDQLIVKLEEEISQAHQKAHASAVGKDQLFESLENEYRELKQAFHSNEHSLMQKEEQIEELKLQLQTHRDRIEDLQQQIRSSGIEELHKVILLCKNQLKESQQKLELEREIVTGHQQTIQRLEETIAGNTKEIDSLKLERSKQEEYCQKAKSKVEKAELEMNRAVEKSKAIEKEQYLLKEQIKQLNLSRKSVEKLVEEETLGLREKVSELEFNYEESLNKISELKFNAESQALVFGEEKEALKGELSDCRRKLEQFNKKEHLLRQHLELLEVESRYVREAVQHKNHKVQELEVKVSDLLEFQAELEDKSSYYERKHRMCENALEEVKMELKMTKTMIPDDQQLPNEASEDDLQQKVFILTETNHQMLEKQKRQSALIVEKQNSIQKLEDQMANMRRELKGSNEKCLKLEELTKSLDQRLRKEAQNQEEMQVRSIQDEEQRLRLNKQIEQLKRQLEKAEEDKFVLKSQANRKEEEISSQIAAISELTQTVTELKSEVEQYRSNVEAVNTQNSTLKQRISQIQSSYSSQRPIQVQSQAFSIPIEERMERIEIQSPKYKPVSGSERSHKSKEEEEVYDLKEELQNYRKREEGYMCNVIELQERLDKVREEKQSLSERSMRRRVSSQVDKVDKKQLSEACQRLEEVIQSRVKSRQTQNVLQMLIASAETVGPSSEQYIEDKNQKERNLIQQKAKILSREMQKIKSNILKKKEISIKEKTFLIEILKPFETATGEIVSISEHLEVEKAEQ